MDNIWQDFLLKKTTIQTSRHVYNRFHILKGNVVQMLPAQQNVIRQALCNTIIIKDNINENCPW